MGSASKLPPCKRHITTHSTDGTSIYQESSTPSYFKVPKAGAMARSYAVESVPAKLGGDTDLQAFKNGKGDSSQERRAIVIPRGANLNVVDLEPGGITPFHQTVSIDFSICTIGTIDHELDSGEITRLKPSDHIVQRGTMHRWINASQTEPARFVAVTIGCEPFDVGGQLLREIHMPDEKRPRQAKL